MNVLKSSLVTCVMLLGAIPCHAEQIKLITPSDLKLSGRFRLPTKKIGAERYHEFGRSQGPLAYNPKNDSLVMSGHTHGLFVAEVTIPEPVMTSKISEMPIGKHIQEFGDVTAGLRNKEVQDTRKDLTLSGLCVANGKLMFSARLYYNVGGIRLLSHGLVDSVNTTPSKEQVRGLWRMGDFVPNKTAGWIIQVPPRWRSKLGFEFLTGQGPIEGQALGNLGPGFYGYNVPAKLPANGETIPCKQLLAYTRERPFVGHFWGGSNDWLGYADEYGGAVWMDDGEKSAIVVVGSHGVGVGWYGSKKEWETVGKTLGASPSPLKTGRGHQAPPYEATAWFYNPQDLVEVAQGKRTPCSIQPYATWVIKPHTMGTDYQYIWAAVDNVRNRLFIAESHADKETNKYNFYPVVHVFDLDGKGTVVIPPKNPPMHDCSSAKAKSKPAPTPTPTPAPTPAPAPTPTPAPVPTPTPPAPTAESSTIITNIPVLKPAEPEEDEPVEIWTNNQPTTPIAPPQPVQIIAGDRPVTSDRIITKEPQAPETVVAAVSNPEPKPAVDPAPDESGETESDSNVEVTDIQKKKRMGWIARFVRARNAKKKDTGATSAIAIKPMRRNDGNDSNEQNTRRSLLATESSADLKVDPASEAALRRRLMWRDRYRFYLKKRLQTTGSLAEVYMNRLYD